MIRKTYLALSRTGRVVQSFSEEALARSFADRMRAQSVPIDLVVETTAREPLDLAENVTRLFRRKA